MPHGIAARELFVKEVRVLSAVIGIVLIIGTGGGVIAQTAVNPSITGFYVSINGEATGPCDMSRLRQLIIAGQLTRNSYVWKEGMQNWVFASTVRELESLFTTTPPPPPQQTTPPLPAQATSAPPAQATSAPPAQTTQSPPPQTTQSPSPKTTPTPVSQQQEQFDDGWFELGASFYMWDWDILEKVFTPSVGFNIAGISYFDNTIGVGAYGNLIYGFGRGLIADALVGPAFRFIRTGWFSMPVAVGLALNYAVSFVPPSSYESKSKISQAFNVGVGANLTAEFKLSQKLHLYARIQGAYGFLPGRFFFAQSAGVGF